MTDLAGEGEKPSNASIMAKIGHLWFVMDEERKEFYHSLHNTDVARYEQDLVKWQNNDYEGADPKFDPAANADNALPARSDDDNDPITDDDDGDDDNNNDIVEVVDVDSDVDSARSDSPPPPPPPPVRQSTKSVKAVVPPAKKASRK